MTPSPKLKALIEKRLKEAEDELVEKWRPEFERQFETGSLDEMFSRAAGRERAKAASGIIGSSGWRKLLP